MTVATDPHKTHHYSHDQLAKVVFEMEISKLKRDSSGHNSEVLGLVESYLKERVNEIKERWK